MTEREVIVVLRDLVREWARKFGTGGISTEVRLLVEKTVEALTEVELCLLPNTKAEVVKIAIVRSLGETLYLNGELLHHVSDYFYLPYALKILGFEVEVLEPRWEDMPRKVNLKKDEGTAVSGICPDGSVRYAPQLLSDLNAHLKQLKEQERKQRIQSLKEELASLEGEDHDCN